MSFLSYVKDHFISILLYVTGIAFTVFSLWALRVNSFLILEVCIVLVGIGITIFILEYTRTYRYFKDILNRIEQLDKKYLVHELQKTPSYYEGKLFHDILSDANKAMLDHVNAYKHQMEDFKEYIELWVHEIKIPLASARLIMENQKDPSLQEELKRVEDYVEQVLFYARSENVEKDYRIQLKSLDTMLKNVIKRNRKDFIYKKISLEYEPTSLEVYTDAKWMEFILNQIISNCIKYGKEENATIKIRTSENKNSVLLVIEDNGIGILEKDVDQVFHKGFTGENGRSRYNSTGIGLYLCKSLCDKLHHQITISSIVNEGVTIGIEFPKSSMMNINESLTIL